MAILKGPLDFTGKLGELNAYTMKSTGKVVLRKKGSVSKKRIKRAPEFERTRQNYTEFSACTMLTAAIRDAAFPVKHLSDNLCTGQLNAIAKKIQLRDDVHNRGERNISLSRYRHVLTGFNFNNAQPFDQVIRHPLTIDVSREECSATIIIPKLEPGFNFYLPWPQTHYRFIVCLGLAGDVELVGGSFQHLGNCGVSFDETEWAHVENTFPATTLHLQLPVNASPANTLVLCIGVEMGIPDRFNEIAPVKKAGAAKILAAF